MRAWIKKIFFKPKRVCFVGVGGGGSNIVEQIANFDAIHTFVHLNSDMQALKQKKHGSKIVLGYKDKQGLGCGANVACGTSLFDETCKAKLKPFLDKKQTLCLVSTLGGGVGSGVTPHLVAYLKKQKQPFRVVAVMPFGFEGKKRKSTATQSLEQIKKQTQNLYTILNDTCLKKGSQKGYLESLEEIAKEVYERGVG